MQPKNPSQSLDKTYTQLLQSIQKEVSDAVSDIKHYMEYEKVAKNWHTGRSIVEYITKHDLGPQLTEQLHQRLIKDLNTSKRIIQYSVQFYRAYPKLPAENQSLKWTHYLMLISIVDLKERRSWEKKIFAENINTTEIKELLKGVKKLESPVFSEKIKFLRGVPFLYRIVKVQYIGGTQALLMLDCGFTITLERVDLTEKQYQSGHLIQSQKVGQKYQVVLKKHSRDQLYTYKAFVERVVDADTLLVVIDVGFGIKLRERVRLRGIDSEEVYTETGRAAKKYVEDVLSKTKFIALKTYRSGKYGRYLVDVFYLPGSNDIQGVAEKGIFLNQELLDQGLSEIYT